jgi:hypothetical protein
VDNVLSRIFLSTKFKIIIQTSMKTILKDKSKSSSNESLNGMMKTRPPERPPPPVVQKNPKPKTNIIFRWLRKLWSFLKLFYYKGGEYILDMIRAPSLKSSAVMALGLCFTFVGYEYSRAASITLLAGEVSIC